MAYFHPYFQGIMIIAMVVAWVLGMMRLRKPRANDILRFRRKLHMKVGKLATIGVIMGTIGGFATVYLALGKVFVTELHGQAGVMAAFFALMGLVTGRMMEKHPGEQPNLPRVHGMINAIGLAFCLFQLRTGLILIEEISKAAKAAG